MILHIILGIVMMMFTIDPKSTWNTAERWVGSFLLWHMIINWSGIRESKLWLLTWEILRLTITCTALIYFSGQPALTLLNLALVALTLISMIWSLLFFRVYLLLRLNRQP
jgi:alkylglycerol monooxygenase